MRNKKQKKLFGVAKNCHTTKFLSETLLAIEMKKITKSKNKTDTYE